MEKMTRIFNLRTAWKHIVYGLVSFCLLTLLFGTYGTTYASAALAHTESAKKPAISASTCTPNPNAIQVGFLINGSWYCYNSPGSYQVGIWGGDVQAIHSNGFSGYLENAQGTPFFTFCNHTWSNNDHGGTQWISISYTRLC